MDKQQQIIADILGLIALIKNNEDTYWDAFGPAENIEKLTKAANLVEDCFIPKDLL